MKCVRIILKYNIPKALEKVVCVSVYKAGCWQYFFPSLLMFKFYLLVVVVVLLTLKRLLITIWIILSVKLLKFAKAVVPHIVSVVVVDVVVIVVVTFCSL